jgi:hypothetical protein
MPKVDETHPSEAENYAIEILEDLETLNKMLIEDNGVGLVLQLRRILAARQPLLDLIDDLLKERSHV